MGLAYICCSAGDDHDQGDDSDMDWIETAKESKRERWFGAEKRIVLVCMRKKDLFVMVFALLFFC